MRFLPIALALSHAAFAQSENLEIRTLSLGGGELPRLWVAEGETAVPLVFSTAQPSLPVRATRLQPMPVFSGDLDEKGKPKDTKPTPVKLPAGPAILLLGWLNDAKPGLLAIPDPFRSAKFDDWIVINTTAENIAIQIGAKAKPVQIKPGAHSELKITAPPNDGAAATIAFLKDKEWKTFYSAYLPVFADSRCLVIISKDGDRLRANIISDTPPPAAPKE